MTDPSNDENDVKREEVLTESRRRTRRSFLMGGAGAAAGAGLYAYLNLEPTREMQPALLRHAYEANEAVSRALFREQALATTYSLSKAENLRVNGTIGLNRALVPESWRLQVVGVKDSARHPRYTQDVTAWQYRYEESDQEDHDDGAQRAVVDETTGKPQADDNGTGRPPRGLAGAGESDSTLSRGTPGLLLIADDLEVFPKQEFVTQFKCIEGWSQYVHWSGIRFADFLDAYPPELNQGHEPKYAYMETPDGDYYVGYDMHVLRHPQTLLVTEMMGKPIPPEHGAPLRLHTPLKYGYKQIKRIGLIAYTDSKPDDYWTKLGYDWYAGL